MADSRVYNLTQGTPSATDVGVYTNGTTTYKYAFNTIKGALQDTFEINFLIGNAGTTAITQTGMYPYFRTNFAGTIEGCEVMSGTILGNATIDIWKGNYGTPPTGTSQSIIGTATKPFYTGGSKFQATTSAWPTTTFSAGDVFAINLNGAGTVPFVSVMIHGKKL